MASGYLILPSHHWHIFLGLAILPWACTLVSLSSKAEVTCPWANGHCLSQQVKLEEFGRPKIDGELKVRSIVNHTKQDR